MSLRLLSPRERIIHLKATPLFARLSPVELLPLADRLEERSYRRGQLLIEPESPVAAGMITIDGEVELEWDNVVVSRLRPPSELGFLGLLARIEGGVRARALEETRVLGIRSADLLRIYDGHPEILIGTIRSLARQVVERRGGYPADPDNPPSVEDGIDPAQPLGFVEQLLEYRRMILFRDSSLDSIAELVHAMSQERVPAGTLLWSRGDYADSTVRVLSGVVTCQVRDDEEPMRIGANYTLGLDSLAGLPRAFTMRAETELVILRGSVEAFLGVLEDRFELGLSMASSMARLVVSVQGSQAETVPVLPLSDEPPVQYYVGREFSTSL